MSLRLYALAGAAVAFMVIAALLAIAATFTDVIDALVGLLR